MSLWAARGERAKTMATSLLADYASQDADALTDLVLAADAVSDKTLFPVLRQHQAAAVRNLQAVIGKQLKPGWSDAVLDASLNEPSTAVRARIESAHGLIEERFAFCQDMPLSQFPEVVESLRTSGYRPTRIRPHQFRPRAASLRPPAVRASSRFSFQPPEYSSYFGFRVARTHP